MNYNDLLETISEVVNNDKIYKAGLIMVYELDELNHKKIDEHLYYKSNPGANDFTHRDIVDVEVNDVVIRFVKKNKL